jgi:hypothetical protein
MAYGVTKNTSVIGIMAEVTEGTYVVPAATTDYLQPLEDGFEMSPSKELLARTVLTSSVGGLTPRIGMKSVEATLPVEYRASGVEGDKPDFDLLLKGCLGNSRQITTNVTTKNSGNTGSVLQIGDSDIGSFTVGDIICVKESGGHHVCAVTAKSTGTGTATITITPAKSSGSFSNSVVLSKSTTYYPANSGHQALSLSYYLGNEIRQTAIGCKVKSLSIDNFQTGQIASFNFGLEGLSFDEIDGAAPHTPSFDTGLPPIILGATVYQDGVALDLNAFALSVTNTLGFITSTASANGKISSRVTKREVTGTINPYMDDTSVAQFTKFNAQTAFSLFIKAYNPSAVSGEITMGSIVGIYLPNCTITEKKVGDKDGILINELSFTADRGTSGANDEIFIGLI